MTELIIFSAVSVKLSNITKVRPMPKGTYLLNVYVVSVSVQAICNLVAKILIFKLLGGLK